MIESKRLRNTKSTRCELRILDYRNGKYQGMTEGSNLEPSGMGIAINEDFLLAIALWKKSKIDGEVFIIYPDQTIFYGFLKGDFPHGICCYEVARKMQIFGLLQNAGEDLFVLDWKGAKTLVFVSLQKPFRGASNQKGSFNEYQSGHQNINFLKNVQIVKQYRYNSSDQKWDAIEEYFKQIVKLEMKSYKNFLRYYFNSQVTASNIKLQLVELKEEVQINFAGTSIMCRITDNPGSTNDFKVKMIGFYDHEQREMDFYRKQDRTNVVEQGVKGQAISYRKQQPYRPLECLKRLKRYYRESLNFKNQFLNLESTKKVKNIFEVLERYVNQYCTNNYAQKLLENPRILPVRQSSKKSKELAAQDQSSERNADSLKKMKEDIARQVRLKRQSIRTSPRYLQRSRRASPKYLQGEQLPFRREVVDWPARNYPVDEPQIYSRTRRPYKYLYENPLEDQSSKRLNNKKSYVYLLNDSQSQKMEIEDNPKFQSSNLRVNTQYEKEEMSPYLKLKDKNEREVPRQFRGNSHIGRPREGSDEENFNNKRSEPLKTLVNDYELIQSKLKKKCPNILNEHGAYLQKRRALDQVYKNVTPSEEEIKSRSPSYQKSKSAKRLKKDNEGSPSPAKKAKQKASWR